MSEGFVALTARGDEKRIAADDGLLWRFSGMSAKRALPQDRLGVVQIALNKQLYFFIGNGQIDDGHLATQAVKGVIAGGDDAAAGVQNEITIGVALKAGEDFIEDGNFFGEILRFSLGICGAVRPTHPGGDAINAGIATRIEDRGEARFDLIVAADGGTAESSEILGPVGFAGTRHTDESET